MKKSLLVLTAALSFGLAAAQTAPAASAPQVPTLTDIPAGHWAKDAIDKIVARGIILGYPDGTFRGTQNLTRYEAAVIIARLLDQIASGTVSTTTGTTTLNPDELTALQNAVQELAADLAALGVRVSDLEENAVNADDFARLEARVDALGAATGNEDAVAELTAQLADFNTRADELAANYDTLRADVDDNASSIAALNDLTVLLNNDILSLQDRVSTTETQIADLTANSVTRADYNNLVGRVSTGEAATAALTTRVANLERNAFSIAPSISIGYSVSRANRNFDVDRLFQLTGDGVNASNLLTSGGIDTDNGYTGRDFGDFGNDTSAILRGAAGVYGFATAAGPVYAEGRTNIEFGLGFNTSGGFNQVTSQSGGTQFSTAGKLSVNSINVSFGITSTVDGSAVTTSASPAGPVGTNYATAYPSLVDSAGNTYRPLFLRFNNATAEFSVGNNPVIVKLGVNQRFFFGDYAFDNNYDNFTSIFDFNTGAATATRNSGYTVWVDGSNVPVIGAFKPTIYTVYGSRADGIRTPASGFGLTNAGDGTYYRGIRATIMPVGSLRLGVHVAQQGKDAFGSLNTLAAATPNDVTVYGADAHGTAYGVSLHSETAISRVTSNAGVTTNANAFYIRVGTQNTAMGEQGATSGNRAINYNVPGATFGPATQTTGINAISIYDLNYRQISANYDATSAINQYGFQQYAGRTTGRNPDNGATGPYANLSATNTTAGVGAAPFIGQKGFGFKLAGVYGPVYLGAYYDLSTGAAGNLGSPASDPNTVLDRGASAKLNATLGGIGFTVRGNYNEYLSNRPQTYRVYNQATGNVPTTGPVSATRQAAQVDIAPGFGLSIGAFYRNVNVNGARATTDRGLFSRSVLASSFGTGNDATFASGLNCADNNFGSNVTDIDGVGNVLNPKINLTSNRTSTCFSAYGVELAHNGKDSNALVKDLSFRLGAGRLYNEATNAYDANLYYGDVIYGRDFGGVNVDLRGSFSNNSIGVSTSNGALAPGGRGSVGLTVGTPVLAGLPFKPRFNGNFGYYTSNFAYTPADIGPEGVPYGGTAGTANANALKYGAGIVLSDVLLPNTQLAVRYDGYRAFNREYVPLNGSSVSSAAATAAGAASVASTGYGFFRDAVTNTTINLNGVYAEGAYNDLVFGYGVYRLSAINAAGTQIGSGLGDGQPANGQTFKIAYKVAF